MKSIAASKKMVGQACYLIINSLEYMVKFNNKTNNEDDHDEDYTKVLLMMPMVPEKNWNFELDYYKVT